MRAVVVYESIFGNTREVAGAVAEGLRSRFEVVVSEVEGAPRKLTGVDLLVVGGPIHAWTMSREMTRKGAREQAAAAECDPVSEGAGIREYLRELCDGRPDGAAEITAAAFDTALSETGWLPTGSAAKPAAKRLVRKGFHILVPPEHFYVAAVQGPVEEGELARARAWGIGLADAYMRWSG